MVAYANTAEGGSNGTAVTTANSGGASGSAWANVVTEAPNGAITFEAAAAYRGGLGYWARATGATNARTNLRWTGFGTGRLRFRAYLNFRSFIGSQFMQILGTGGVTSGISGYVQLDTSGRLFVIDSSNVNHGTKSQPPIPLNTWVRFEIQWGSGTSNGVVRFRVYEGDSLTPFITYDVTTAGLAANLTGFNWIKTNLSGAWNPGLYFDEVAADDSTSTDFIGPVAPDVPPTLDLLRQGSGLVQLAVGGSPASRAYVGSVQVWP